LLKEVDVTVVDMFCLCARFARIRYEVSLGISPHKYRIPTRRVTDV